MEIDTQDSSEEEYMDSRIDKLLSHYIVYVNNDPPERFYGDPFQSPKNNNIVKSYRCEYPKASVINEEQMLELLKIHPYKYNDDFWDDFFPRVYITLDHKYRELVGHSGHRLLDFLEDQKLTDKDSIMQELNYIEQSNILGVTYPLVDLKRLLHLLG
jgi:hypothetical protein